MLIQYTINNSKFKFIKGSQDSFLINHFQNFAGSGEPLSVIFPSSLRTK